MYIESLHRITVVYIKEQTGMEAPRSKLWRTVGCTAGTRHTTKLAAVALPFFTFSCISHGKRSNENVVFQGPSGGIQLPVPHISMLQQGGTQDTTVTRRECFQRKLRESLGYDLNPNYYLTGCNFEAIWGFDDWANRTGCGREELNEDLIIHTAWAGSIDTTLAGKQSVQRDLEALLDSFLVSQDTKRSKLIFWWLGRDPNPSDPMESKYTRISNGSITFRTPDLVSMSIGTPLENRHDILSMGTNMSAKKKNKRPRQLANMFRTLVLYNFGGIWVDTDTIILRDFRPLFEYTGEFATQLCMSRYYNNNFMGLRKHSRAGRHMLTTIAETGLPPVDEYGNATNPIQYCSYVTRSGGDCYDIWYWNHGSIQLLVREAIGIVVLPTSFSDPGELR